MSHSAHLPSPICVEVLAIHIRAQNAALILRRCQDTIVFEVFGVLPPPEAVMIVMGKLICEYPGHAVELPLDVAQDQSFVEQLVSFLVHMNIDHLETATDTRPEVPEIRGTAHPRYISQLLIMIFRGMGKEAEVKRITKRITDDVCWGWDKSKSPWRRSSLWLVLRVAVQTTADSRETYKAFTVFFQTQLLQLFLDHKFSSDLLHAARVKTSRRVHKLGVSAPPSLLQAVEAVSCMVDQHLQTRWSEEQRLQAISPIFTLDSTTIEEDTTISLLESRAHLTKIMRPDHCSHSYTAFDTSHFPRLLNTYDFRHLHHDHVLTKAVQAEPYVALADFEFIVQERLDGWVLENSQDEIACETLESCLEQYISATKLHYSTNPEAKSLMLLTIMELWVALDAIAVIQCPLLSSYSPEIPPSFLHPLLLRQAKSMERASRIELYLLRRHSDAAHATSIFSDNLNDASFAVRYFQISPPLQTVKASVEQAAAQIREKKILELQEMNARHTSLTEEIAKLSCKYVQHYELPVHASKCSKCKLQKVADSLHIRVHEWPLPNHPLESMATIFELNCPRVFAIWRACTYQILRDIGMADVEALWLPHHPVLLNYYEGLAKWSKKNISTSGRITLGSSPLQYSSQDDVQIPANKDVKIPANEDSVFVKNGLRFRLYDSWKKEFVLSSFDVNLGSYCTLRLPQDGKSLYRHLQSAVTHTTHTHNETLANQSDCPMNLSLHEHLAFSNLRCGSQLQWKNIVRELRTNLLTFSCEEVHTLITQASWQIGPLSDDGSTRQWHFELGVPDFGHVLIREATNLLSRVEANWMEGTTVKTISMSRCFANE